MVDMKNKRCTHHGCSKRPSFGKAGGKPVFCRDHAEDGMANVVSKRCDIPGCTTRASYAEKNMGTRKFCARHAQEGVASDSGRPSGDSRTSGGTDIGAARRESGTAMGACSGGRQRNRAPPPTPSDASPGRSRVTNKRARRSAGGGDLRPVHVKREGGDNRVPDDEKSGACPEPDAVVKTEDMEMSFKEEPTEAAGGAQLARMERRN